MRYREEICEIKVIQDIIHKIRLFRHPKKESFFALYKLLGFFPNDIRLYEEALLHKSSSKEYANEFYRNNERLEFLGDSILGSIVADILYKRYPHRNEGFLTRTRSKIVKRETLDYVAEKLGLHQWVVSSFLVKSRKTHILGNALEAFIGAIYLDQGYRKTRQFIEKRILEPYIDIEDLAKKEVNFKSKLFEWSQKQKVDLTFELLENLVDGDRNPIFQSQVFVNGVPAGSGTGYSKRESQQQAAQMALDKIRTDQSFFIQN